MSTVSSNGQQSTIKALEARAGQILKARPAYQEILDFYLTVFRRQIEWRDKLVVQPEPVNAQQRQECLKDGDPLIERYDPGLDPESLLGLWTEMKSIFREGNDVLRQAMDKIDQAEMAGKFSPATWLLEQRPERDQMVTDAASRIGVDESLLATLARAVTFPHWKLVAQSWLPPDALMEWKRYQCPTCGGLPGLVETHTDQNAGSVGTASRRYMHCPFCASRWIVPTLNCPACDSAKEGDAKYYFTPEEPELRIDFCNKCKHYVKVVDADKTTGLIHVGLELLTSTHLDAIAHDKKLTPLGTCG